MMFLPTNRESIPVAPRNKLVGEGSHGAGCFGFLDLWGLIMRLPSTIEASDDRLPRRFPRFEKYESLAFGAFRM